MGAWGELIILPVFTPLISIFLTWHIGTHYLQESSLSFWQIPQKILFYFLLVRNFKMHISHSFSFSDGKKLPGNGLEDTLNTPIPNLGIFETLKNSSGNSLASLVSLLPPTSPLVSSELVPIHRRWPRSLDSRHSPFQVLFSSRTVETLLLLIGETLFLYLINYIMNFLY